MSRFEPDPSLTPEQRSLLEDLTRTLQPGHALWLSGYFAGLGRAALQAVPNSASGLAATIISSALAPATRTLTILFGSETGNCSEIATAAADAARAAGLNPNVADMAQYKTQRLRSEQDLLVITSTHGEGDPPQSAKPFFEFLESRKAPKLPDLRYAVLALGDSTYEQYCGAGQWLDKKLSELGATALEDRVDCDVDYDESAAVWIYKIVAKLNSHASLPNPNLELLDTTSPGTSHAERFDKRRPFLAPVIGNFALTGRGSSKETRHIELSLEGSNLKFKPGDSLGIYPRNDPALVETIASGLDLKPEAPVTLKNGSMSLREALATQLEISAVTPRLLSHWAELSGSGELRALADASDIADRAAFLRTHHVVDVLQRFPVTNVEAQDFVDGLRPLQPRLYSIASSQTAFPEEVHLTIATLRYELQGKLRTGVTSGYFAERIGQDELVRVYAQPNSNFKLAADDVPVLMIGAGTGVAPYRAFVQEREARGAKGKAWLVFGERNFHSDFLYQTEWQDWLKGGVLSRMTVAFSRDSARKVYVQHRLKEQARDVYAWLQEGAHVYVCGASSLAPEIHTTLRDIIEMEGGVGRAAADDYLANLQRDRRYQVDVY